MKEFEIKKIIVPIIVAISLFAGFYFGYEYVTEPKIVDGVVSKNIDDEGNPTEITKTFSPEDSVHFSAKQNRFWIKKAQIVWYKGEIKTENRLFVEKEVSVNEAGYFSTKLADLEGLEEGRYGVTIYVDGKEVMETKAVFDVKQ
ncbi:hypothetical protein [Metabacillus malikii]|uniref:Uncharacterized protein n=1 Tax=Metabacillus malikii TaxID=1504265 RepID=A0ABT9ZDE8_9BACI|nr:hypothetical protein [Metabacillus malikii]MDQ0230290.1 hypothetical protein [Metabacillus malikii]